MATQIKKTLFSGEKVHICAMYLWYFEWSNKSRFEFDTSFECLFSMNFESSFARIIDLIITGRSGSRSGNCPEKISHFDHFFRIPRIDNLDNSASKICSVDHDSDLEFLKSKHFSKIMFSCETHRWWTLGQFQKNVFCPTLILGYSYLVTLKMGLGLMNPAPKSRKKEPNGCVCTPVYIGSRLLVQSGNCILAIACNNFQILTNIPILWITSRN